MFEKVIELDPACAPAHACLGLTYLREWALEFSDDPAVLDRAWELAQEAKALNASLPLSRVLVANVHAWKRRYDKAIVEGKAAIALDPNDADAHAGLAQILIRAGRPEEAVEMVEKAMRLNPSIPG